MRQRTGRAMPGRRFKITVLATAGDAVANRIAFVRALSDLGHEVKTAVVGRSARRDTLRRMGRGECPDGFTPDFLLLFCNVFSSIAMSASASELLSSFPYVTVWDSNPLRVLYFLRHRPDNHLALFVLDRGVVDELHGIGYPQAVYFPYFYADPDVFRPHAPVSQYAHDVAFAGTFFPPNKAARLCNGPEAVHWTDEITAMIEDFRRKRREERSYVDVYRFVRDRLDVSAKEGQEVSVRLLLEQKWMEREQLFGVLSRARIHCHIYGGKQANYHAPNLNSEITINSPYVHLHGFLNKHSELPNLYTSTSVHLCCTQFPRACHERLFQSAASGAFLLHEWKEDVPALFEPGREVILYRHLDELPDLIRYYLTHESERRNIANRAHRRFLAEHTPAHRARFFTEVMSKRLDERRSQYSGRPLSPMVVHE